MSCHQMVIVFQVAFGIKSGFKTKYFGGTELCDTCKGNRLRPEALNVFLGKQNKTEQKSSFSNGLALAPVPLVRGP